MLQGVKAQIGQPRGLFVAVNAEDTALFSEFIEHNFYKKFTGEITGVRLSINNPAGDVERDGFGSAIACAAPSAAL